MTVRQIAIGLVTAALVCLFPMVAHAQTTAAVTGNLKDILGGNLGSRTFINFRLRHSDGSFPVSPRVIGVGIIVRSPLRVKPDSNGLISTTLFRNDVIEPAGTFWTVEYHFNGRFQHSQNFNITGATLDLNNDTPITVTASTALVDSIIRQDHTQFFTSLTTWTINHNFNSANVSCDFFDATGKEFFPDMSFPTDVNTWTGTFITAESGKATCSSNGLFSFSEDLTQVWNLNPSGSQTGGNGQTVTWDGVIAPVDATDTLGTSSNPWGAVYAQTVLPDVTGRDLGTTGARWDAFINDLDVAAVVAPLLPNATGLDFGSSSIRWDAFLDVTSTGRLNNVRKCDSAKYAGADASAKLATCFADFLSTGGTADARGFEGAQAFSSNPWAGITAPIKLLVGAATFTVEVELVLPDNAEIEGIGEASVFLAGSGLAVGQSMFKGSDETNGNSGIRLRNFVIDMDRDTQAPSSHKALAAIRVWGWKDFIIEDITILDAQQDGFYFGSNVAPTPAPERGVIRRINIRGVNRNAITITNGIDLTFDDIDIFNVRNPKTSGDTGSGGIDIEAPNNGINLNFSNIRIRDVDAAQAGQGVGFTVSATSGVGIEINNVTITRTNSVGFNVTNGRGSMSNIWVTRAQGSGLIANSPDWEFSNIHVFDNGRLDFEGAALAAGAPQLVISDSRLAFNNISANNGGAEGVEIQSGAEIIIDGAILRNNGQIAGSGALARAGIDIRSSAAITNLVLSNLFAYDDGTSTQQQGIIFGGAVGTVHISNSRAFGNAANDYVIPTSGTVVMSNFFDGTNHRTETDRIKAKGTALVAGDIDITHASWGTGETVTAITGNDQWFQFTVNSGTTAGASPQIIVTFTDGTFTNAPIVLCNRQEFAVNPTFTISVTTVTATAITLTFDGTPTDSSAFRFACHVGGI